MSYDTITVGGVTLSVVKLRKRKVASQIIQKLGKTLVYHDIPGRGNQDYIIELDGVIVSEIGTARTNLLALEDCNKHHYSDGLITASVLVVPGSLTFDDDSEKPLHYEYNLVLRQINNDWGD